MSLTRKKQNMHLLVVLSNLLLENLDELKPTKKELLKYKENLTAFCELLNNEIKDTEAVKKTIYFQEISNKVDTIIRKNFNENM